MEGPYDDKLHWLLKGTFKATLLNQSSDTEHHSATGSVDCVRITSSNDFDIINVWHKTQFINRLTLRRSRYLKNDSLFFEVSKL